MFKMCLLADVLTYSGLLSVQLIYKSMSITEALFLPTIKKANVSQSLLPSLLSVLVMGELIENI